MERLDKVVAAMGRWSRREVKTLVREGRILVDGRIASAVDCKVDPAAMTITVDGEDLGWKKHTWLMMNKPAGLLSATRDGRGDGTVLDLLTPELRRRELFPVGRLDKDTVGLLLLTNDGALAHELLSPKKHVDKTYFVRVDGRIDESDCAAFAAGMELGDGLHCLPAKLEPGKAEDEAFVTLHEGKFHQIKRMFAARNKPVLYLKRISMGGIPLDPALQEGEYRYLTEEELADLSGFDKETQQIHK